MPEKVDQKLKAALDETRLLVLGVQILLGFEFQAVFQDGFGSLDATQRGVRNACEKGVELLIGMILAAPHEEPVNFCQHDDVDHRDGEQEEHRDQRADHAADFDQSREALLEAARS